MRRRRRAKKVKEKRKRENRRPILKKLYAALLRSFRGQHSEKIKGSARGNWDPRESQQPFRLNPNGAGDRTTTLRRLLIGAITPSGTQEVLPTTAGRKYSTRSFLLTSSPSMTLTHLTFSIAPLAVALPLTSPLLPPLLLFLAPGRCYRTWVLTICQFFYLSLSLRSFAPTSVPHPSILRKLAGMGLSLILTLTVFQQRNTRLFLFPLLLLFLPL